MKASDVKVKVTLADSLPSNPGPMPESRYCRYWDEYVDKCTEWLQASIEYNIYQLLIGGDQ